jgi:hypothetical protein
LSSISDEGGSYSPENKKDRRTNQVQSCLLLRGNHRKKFKNPKIFLRLSADEDGFYNSEAR